MAPYCRIRGRAAAIAVFLLVPAFSQTNPPSSSSGSSGSGSKTPSPTTPSITGNPTNNTQQTTTQSTLRVSGRVIMEDGSPLSFPAIIERVCNGSPHAEGYTDTKGYFSLILGQNMEVIADASEVPTGNGRLNLPGGIATTGTMSAGGGGSNRALGGITPYSNCELRAALGGYMSQTINLTGRTTMDNPDVGTITLRRMGSAETATTVTASTLKAPKEARRALDKGLDFAKKNKPEQAIASLEEAVKIDPDFAFAWNELGRLQLANGHTPDAHESFEAAAKAEPRWPEPYLSLAVMAVKAHDWREVAATTEKVLHLSTWEYPQAYFFNGAANFNLHHIDVAEKDALAAEKLDTQHLFPQIQQLLGMIYVEQNRYADAVQKFRSYLLLAPDAEDAPLARKQLAISERLAAQAAQVAEKEQDQ
jgi:tetratricopeptide (TPR) repeat protein